MPVHWTHAMGGAEYQVKCIIDLLKKNGQYEIFYLTRHVNDSYRPDGYKIITIRNMIGFPNGRHLFDGFSLLKEIHNIKPDIVYQRVGMAYTGFAAWYAQRFDCKFVWHIAHDDDVTPRHVGTGRKATGGGVIEKKFIEYGIRNAHAIIAQTKEQSLYLERYYHRKPSVVLGNFHPRPKEHIEKSKPISIVWIANIKPIKQLEIFLRLAQDIGATHNVKFQVIGRLGKSRWANQTREKIDAANYVNYLGALSQDEVNAILKCSDILVNTSKREGFSNTFIQAWMRKVPVVSLKVDPNDLLKQGKIGYCSGNYKRLKKDVIKLIECGEQRDIMGSAAQAYAFDHHSEDEGEKLLAYLQ